MTDQFIEQSQKTNGTIWGITTFFNPAQYESKYSNYKIFRESSRRQGLQLVAVELVFGNDKFELNTDDAEILVQIRGDEKNILWQKEAMLNIALKKLPPDCDKIIWIDCDVIFNNDKWIGETSLLLDKYSVVQPFSLSVNLKQYDNDKILENIKHIEIDKLEIGQGENQKRYGAIYSRIISNNKNGHPGYVWSARRSVFYNIAFYDRMVTGSADTILLNSFYSPRLDDDKRRYFTDVMCDHISKYLEALYMRVKGNVYFTNGTLFHLNHGSHMDRNYITRLLILQKTNFDPNIDIRLNSQGILEWTDKNKNVDIFKKIFFLSRNEDLKFNLFKTFYYKIYLIGPMTLLRIKIDRLMGKIGHMIGAKYPKVYARLSKYKVGWAKSLFE